MSKTTPKSTKKPTQLDRIEALAKSAHAESGLAHAATLALQQRIDAVICSRPSSNSSRSLFLRRASRSSRACLKVMSTPKSSSKSQCPAAPRDLLEAPPAPPGQAADPVHRARPTPPTIEGVGEAYIAQMAAYRAVLTQRWPNRPIRCLLVWTDGPRLIEIPLSALDRAFKAINP